MNRHFTALWLLFLAAFAIFTVASAFDMPEIAGHKLTSAGFADVLFPESSHDDAGNALSDTEIPLDIVPPDTDFVEPPLIPAPCDTAAQTILFIGDSMLEGLGPRLAAYADYNGHSLYSVIWYSSTSEKWGKSDKLRRYIERIKPSFIFVCLGANELLVKNIAEKRDKYVKSIIADIDTIPYLWIGPPNWRDDTGINNLIAANSKKGTFFRSEGMSFDRAADGAHPTRSSAAAWLDSVVRWMPQNALHPIRLESPAAATGRPKKVYVHQPAED